MKPKKSIPFRSSAARLLLPSTFLMAASSVFAADFTWDAGGGITRTWQTAANWNGDILPTFDDQANIFFYSGIDSATSVIGDDRTIGSLNFNSGATAAMTLFLSDTNLEANGKILTLGSALVSPTITVDAASANHTIGATKGSISLANHLTATVNGAASLTIARPISGTGFGLTKSGSGTLLLNSADVNTFTGGLNVSGGTLALDYGNLATPANLIGSGNALTLGGGSVLTITGKDSATNTSQTFSGTTFGSGVNSLNITKGASAASATLNLGALTTNPGSATTILPGATWATGVPSTTEIVKVTSFNGNALPVSGKVNVGAGVFYRQSASAGAARWVSVDSSGQLQALPQSIAGLAATTADPVNAYQISGSNITLTNTAASSYGLVLNPTATNRTLTLATDGTYTINGILGVSSTSGRLSIINPGTGTSNLVIGSERNLVINMDTVNGVTINAPIANNGSTGGIGGTASAVTIASTIPTGTSGAVTLAGNNTYSGGTYYSSSGALVLAHSNAAGTGTIHLASTQTGTATTLNISGGIDVANAIEIQSETGRNSISSSGASNTYSGNITINNAGNNSIVINNAAAAGTTFTVGGAVPNSTTITADSYSNVLSFRAGTNGALGVLNSRIDAPNATFNGNNNGLWTVNSTGNNWRVTSLSNASRFVLGATNALATGARLDLSGTGFLDLNGFNQTVAGLGGSSSNGAITNNSSGSDSTLTLEALASDLSYNSVITDGATNKMSLVMSSIGRSQTLAGTNTFTGTTTVSAGTLYVSGALSGSAVTVQADGAIGSNGADGTLGNGLTISAGGNLDLVNAVLATNSTGILSLTGGSLTLGNLAFTDLVGWNWADAEAGTYELIDGNGSSALDFGSTAFLDENTAYSFGNGKSGYFTSDPTTFSLNAVIIIPEPSAALLGALGALLLLRRRR